MMPILGLAKKIQVTVNRIPGIIKGTTESVKNNFLNGVLVRSFIQARAVPVIKAKIDDPVAKAREFRNKAHVCELE